jgi:hypothetical protein
MRTRNSTWLIIPNKQIIDYVLVNHSASSPLVRTAPDDAFRLLRGLSFHARNIPTTRSQPCSDGPSPFC